jgi:hypothetical protein
MRGTVRKDQDGWSVVYFVTAEECDAVARVEMKLHEDDHQYVKHEDSIQFEAVKVGSKFVAKLVKNDVHQRVINEHVKQAIL